MTDLDAIRARASDPLASSRHTIESDVDELLAYVDALRAAAAKVQCLACHNSGSITLWTADGWRTRPCPDCTELREFLTGVAKVSIKWFSVDEYGMPPDTVPDPTKTTAYLTYCVGPSKSGEMVGAFFFLHVFDGQWVWYSHQGEPILAEKYWPMKVTHYAKTPKPPRKKKKP